MGNNNDVIIIGGGPSGLSLAILLSQLDLNIVVIEKSSLQSLKNPDYDGRETALTHPSTDFLKNIGIWDKIDQDLKSPIKKAKVLNGFSKYSLDFDNEKSSNEALGYLVANTEIRKKLFAKANKIDNIEIISNAQVVEITSDDIKAQVILDNNKIIKAKLITAADSRFSQARNKMGISADIHDFAKTMIVCKMEHQKNHHNIALECFYEDRVLAVLPLSGKTSSIVITLPSKRAQDLVNLDENKFNKDISNYFAKELGNLKLTSKRYSYPLMGVYANKFVSKRFALVGDAAVGMHPVTAHGFNLGLLGQKNLANAIKNALKNQEDIGSDKVLEEYHKKHFKDTKIMYHGTNLIVNLFSKNNIAAKALRSLMLRTANSKLLPFKSMIANRLTGKRNGLLPLKKLPKLD